MRTVDILEAKAYLSDLIDRAVRGEPFVITRAGEPLVKVTALDAPGAGQVRRLGFLAGEFSVPEDFDRMAADEIQHLFENGT